MDKKIWAACVSLIGFSFWVIWPQHLSVDFFSVGQGDAVLVQHGRRQMLIDGGPDRSVLSKLGRRLPFGDRTIEYLVLTHPHADHFVGLISVLERYRVERIIMTGVGSDSPIYPEFLRAATAEGAVVSYVTAGDRIEFEPETVFEVLAADSVRDGDPNAASIVMKMIAEEGSVIFMGDATAEVEEALLAREASLHADILKVGHHGSRFSTTTAFARAVAPRFAVIEVGKNNYGHPSYAVVRRLEASGTQVFRTDRDGDVRASLGPKGIIVYGSK